MIPPCTYLHRVCVDFVCYQRLYEVKESKKIDAQSGSVAAVRYLMEMKNTARCIQMSGLHTYIAALCEVQTCIYFRPDRRGNFIRPMIRHCGVIDTSQYIVGIVFFLWRSRKSQYYLASGELYLTIRTFSTP